MLQVRHALQELYQNVQVRAPWFPLRLLPQLFTAIVNLSQRLGQYPPGGASASGNIEHRTFPGIAVSSTAWISRTSSGTTCGPDPEKGASHGPRCVDTAEEPPPRARQRNRPGPRSRLAMLLEKNTRPSDESGFYETVLPPDLVRIRLDAQAQAAILRDLARRLSAERVPSAVFWAIGKALPEAAAPVLVEILELHPDLADDHAGGLPNAHCPGKLPRLRP